MWWPKWLLDAVNKDSETWAPVPRIRSAYIAGPTVRWEKSGAEKGTDVFLTALANKKLSNIGAADVGLATDYGITHLQKQSPAGYLITDPWCFYLWIRFSPQKIDAEGTSIPGSETCFTFSVGLGRWDALMQKYMKPRLQMGLHYD